MSYLNICNAIYDVVSVNTDLSATFNYNVKSYEAYPTAVITPADAWETVFDSCDNQWKYTIAIRVVDRNVDEETMEPRMRWICDDLLTSLRAIPLWLTFNKLELSTVWWTIDDEEPLRVFEIKCVCYTLNAI